MSGSASVVAEFRHVACLLSECGQRGGGAGRPLKVSDHAMYTQFQGNSFGFQCWASAMRCRKHGHAEGSQPDVVEN